MMNTRLTHKPLPTLDYLGKQLLMTIAFARLGFPPNELYDCNITQTSVRGADLFKKIDDRYFMVQASIPGDLAVKAIGVDANNVYLESDPLVFQDARPIIEATGATLHGTTIRTNGMVIVSIKTEMPKGHAHERSLWTIPWRALNAQQRDLAVHVVDALYSADAFMPIDEINLSEVGIRSTKEAQQMQQRLDMELMQRLEVEQRPMLALKQRGDIRGEMLQEQQIVMLLAMSQRLLTMTLDELIDEALKDTSPQGIARFQRFATFAAARRVKTAAHSDGRDISWRDARALARKIMFRQSAA